MRHSKFHWLILIFVFFGLAGCKGKTATKDSTREYFIKRSDYIIEKQFIQLATECRSNGYLGHSYFPTNEIVIIPEETANFWPRE